MTEEQLHHACAQYLMWALLPPAWFTTFPSGGGGTKRGTTLKRNGLKAGVPDILIIAHGVAHWPELKTPKGKVSLVQVLCHGDLKAAGCPAVIIVRSLADLKAALNLWQIPVRQESITAERIRRGFQNARAEAGK